MPQEASENGSTPILFSDFWSPLQKPNLTFESQKDIFAFVETALTGAADHYMEPANQPVSPKARLRPERKTN